MKTDDDDAMTKTKHETYNFFSTSKRKLEMKMKNFSSVAGDAPLEPGTSPSTPQQEMKNNLAAS